MNISLRLCLIFASIQFVISPLATAKMGDPGWIFSPTVGISRPNLKPLFSEVFKAPYVGASTIVTDLPEDVQGASAYPREEFFFENELSPVEVAPEAGLEFRRSFGTLSDFVIGVSTWEISSIGRTIATLPLQGVRNNIADYERRAKFSYTQYYLGWRRYFYERTRPTNFYFDFSLHELFDIDYKETHVFSFLPSLKGDENGPIGFKRIAVYKSQSTGLLLLQFGMGVERLFAERFSLSLEGDYSLSIKSGTLRGLNQRSDFNDGDRLTVAPTPIRAVNDEIEVLLPDGESTKKVKLTMDGWRLMAKFNIAF